MCEADVLIQPWLNKQEVKNLQCAEREEFHEGHDSVEVLLPKVHPSAHARPVFRSHFVVRTSDESEESNEVSFDFSNLFAEGKVQHQIKCLLFFTPFF